MNKRVILIVVGIILAIAGFMLLTKPAPESSASPTNHQYSQGSTGIVLMEYGDFECPGCGAYYPIVKEVKEIYKDRITFQFRHLPLVEIHVNALAAARAAEAASNQGKFWEMHDMLFENQNSWKGSNDPLSVFSSYAQLLGLDAARFDADYKSQAVNDTINADINEFEKTGHPKSTPSFFLDGQKIEPDGSVEAFTAILDEAISKKTGEQPPAAQPDATMPEGTEPTGLPPTEEQPAQ